MVSINVQDLTHQVDFFQELVDGFHDARPEFEGSDVPQVGDMSDVHRDKSTRPVLVVSRFNRAGAIPTSA